MLAGFKHLKNSAPSWLRTILIRILNNEETRDLFFQKLRQSADADLILAIDLEIKELSFSDDDVVTRLQLKLRQ